MAGGACLKGHERGRGEWGSGGVGGGCAGGCTWGGEGWVKIILSSDIMCHADSQQTPHIKGISLDKDRIGTCSQNAF